MFPLCAVLFVLISFLQHTAHATRVETFSDDDCKVSLNYWRGPNGYPSGRCTSTLREGNFTSFKIVDPDPGCAITIYAKDTTQDICSGFSKVVEPSTCFNTTWHYYSIDECFKPSASSLSSSDSLSSSAASSSTKTNASGGTGKTSSTLRTTASTTATGSPSITTAASSNGPNVGAIAGGTVGGVVFGLALAGLITWLLLRRRRAKRNHPPPAYSSTDQPVEVAAKEIRPPGPPPAELSQHSIMELQGHAVHEMDGGRHVRGPSGGSGSPILRGGGDGKG